MHRGLRLVERPVDDPELEAERLRVQSRLHIYRAFVELERSGLATALEIIDAVIANADRHDQPDVLAAAHSQKGMLFGRSGRLTLALAEFDRALVLRQSLPARDLCLLHNNRGLTLSHLGNPAAAMTSFEEAHAIATRSGLAAEQWLAMHNLGYASYLCGDLPRALGLMSQSSGSAIEYQRAAVLLDKGRVLLDAGLIGEAVDLLTEAIGHCDEKTQRITLADIHLELTTAYALSGAINRAEQHAHRATRLLRSRTEPTATDRARISALGIQLALGEEPQRLGMAATELRDRAHADGHVGRFVEAGLVVAECHIAGRDWVGAESAVTVVDAAVAKGSLSARLRLHHLRARLAAEAGELPRARRILSRAALELERSQYSIGSIDLRTARGALAAALVEFDLGLSLDTQVATVFARTELWRAATSRLPPVNPPLDPEVAALTAALRAVREGIRSAAERPSAEHLAEASRLERAIRDREWTHHNTDAPTRTETTRPIPLRRARAILAELDLDLASFFGHAGHLHAIAVVSGRAKVLDLGPVAERVELGRRIQADLRTIASRHLGPLNGVVHASMTDSLTRLDDLLLRPLGIGARGLVVVPSRSVAPIPWAMLPSARALPITVARSVASFLRDAHTATTTGPAAVLTGPGLTDGEREAEQVAAVWRSRPGGVTHAPLATRAILLDALQQAQIVHVAAHGRHHAQSPLFSSLDLCDGALFAHELQRGGVRAEHVSLSACEVGAATVRPGDEALGMASTLLSLGARCVVAPLTPVPDAVAADVMIRHHSELAAGRRTDEALAIAIESVGGLAGVFGAFGGRWQRPADD